MWVTFIISSEGYGGISRKPHASKETSLFLDKRASSYKNTNITSINSEFM